MPIKTLISIILLISLYLIDHSNGIRSEFDLKEFMEWIEIESNNNEKISEQISIKRSELTNGFGVFASKNFEKKDLIVEMPSILHFNRQNLRRELKNNNPLWKLTKDNAFFYRTFNTSIFDCVSVLTLFSSQCLNEIEDAEIEKKKEIECSTINEDGDCENSNSNSKEKENESFFWKPFLKTLPSINELDTPLMWEVKERKELKGTYLDYHLRAFLKFSKDYFQLIDDFLLKPNKIDPKLPKNSLCSLKTLLWSISMVASRSFMIGGVSAIVPLVDLFNHQQEKYSISHGEKERGILKRANVLAIETDKLDFQIKAFSEIQQNEEMFISYGNKSNFEHLFHYGFVYPKNDYNCVRLRVQEDGNDFWSNCFRNVDMERASMEDWKVVCDGLDPENSLRTKFSKLYVPELICLRFLKDLATGMLSQFPTTQNEDIERYKTGKYANQRIKNALFYRIGEKKLFGKLLSTLSERLKDIENNHPGYFEVEVKKQNKKSDQKVESNDK